MSGTQHPANFQVLAKIQLFGGGGGGGLLQMLQRSTEFDKSIRSKYKYLTLVNFLHAGNLAVFACSIEETDGL